MSQDGDLPHPPSTVVLFADETMMQRSREGRPMPRSRAGGSTWTRRIQGIDGLALGPVPAGERNGEIERAVDGTPAIHRGHERRLAVRFDDLDRRLDAGAGRAHCLAAAARKGRGMRHLLVCWFHPAALVSHGAVGLDCGNGRLPEALQVHVDAGPHDVARRAAVRLRQSTQRLPLRPPEHQRSALFRALLRHGAPPDMPENAPESIFAGVSKATLQIRARMHSKDSVAPSEALSRFQRAA